jgi:hypothetical protein
VDSLVAISPANARFLDSQGRAVLFSSVIFHELAEAFSKVGKPYTDFELGSVRGGFIVASLSDFQRGAHNDAVQRELTPRDQRPNLQGMRF